MLESEKTVQKNKNKHIKKKTSGLYLESDEAELIGKLFLKKELGILISSFQDMVQKKRNPKRRHAEGDTEKKYTKKFLIDRYKKKENMFENVGGTT